jgi:para-aminobenzoate synthetase/4-amino-4-deoxychorismate lyase
MALRYNPLPELNQEYIAKKDYFFLFETCLFDKDNYLSYIFLDPLKVIKINRYSGVEKAFVDIQGLAKNHYLAGYFSYELGYFFENKQFSFKDRVSYPLIQLCVFDKAICFDHRKGKFNACPSGILKKKGALAGFSVKNLSFNFSRAEYLKRISRIKGHIRRGDTYQINFTGKYRFRFSGSAFSFYQSLKNRQSVPYSAFSKLKDEYLLSFSPELFFKRNGRSIYSKPMKGTIARGKDIEEDKRQVQSLKNSLKDSAENIMIVDLIRNDLGRIAEIKSVKPSGLFNIEKYNTLFQMTSGVRAVLKNGMTYFDIFSNIFPGGSVTGAPKIRSMQIIRKLEKGPRNIYCGALGMILPKDKAVFNMPIRTVSLIGNKGEMGSGSGIVYDSSGLAEYKECMLKAKFLADRYKEFCLLETILWGGEYAFLEEHLERMELSAQYFAFYFNRAKIKKALSSLKIKFKTGALYKVRLLLDRKGYLRIEHSKMPRESGIKYIVVSNYKIDPQNLFCYHKTTNRQLYDSEYIRYHRRGYFDVIFLNKIGEVAEGAISNIIIEKNKIYYTPPLSSGILPGIFRNYFIRKYRAQEKKIFLKDLLRADRIFLSNSVRGLTEVKIKR